jgi:acyl-coenzyme A synthetase/AMP-(fatty) acid ligase
VINHTSGTTGMPKLVVHSSETVINRLARFESLRWPLLGVRPDDTVASASSFAHGRTFCWTASVLCLAPRKIVICGELEPESAVPFLRAHPPTTLEALPSAFARWLPAAAAPDNPFRDVRLFVSTYDAVHPPTVRAFLGASRRGWPLWMQGWGQTETGPLTFRFFTRRSVAAAGRRHPTTRDAGRPIPGRVRLRVVDPVTLRPVPRGRPGLLFAHTGARCLGYLGEPLRWAAKRVGPWWNTGDLGVLTRTGAVRFLDREVDALPALSCVEVEDVVQDRLPQVRECVLLGVPGGLPVPVVATADGRLERPAWRRAVRDLPPMAEPVVLTWSQLPRTGTGKVRRHELSERLLGAVAGAGSGAGSGSGRWT